MIKSKLNLIILVLDDITFEYKILSINESKIVLPYIDITEYLDIDKSIKHIVSSYIKNDVELSVNYKLIDIDIDDNINIYYYCFITFNAKIDGAYALPITQYEKNLPNLQKILRSL